MCETDPHYLRRYPADAVSLAETPHTLMTSSVSGSSESTGPHLKPLGSLTLSTVANANDREQGVYWALNPSAVANTNGREQGVYWALNLSAVANANDREQGVYGALSLSYVANTNDREQGVYWPLTFSAVAKANDREERRGEERREDLLLSVTCDGSPENNLLCGSGPHLVQGQMAV